ncbi:MAG: TlpA family protein disulfide reductase [Desulfobacteraceae bacterium]|nr:MAG: TlpA family protein disulfide reductase [Desulfobacteraceae bacterium]
MFRKTGSLRNRKTCIKACLEISLFKKILLPVAILFLVFALSACRDSEDKTSLPRLGSRAFDFTCRDLQGRTWNLETVRGKVLLLRFWADWCPYCRFEMPVIEKFYRLLGPEGFEVLAVNVKQSAPVAQAFIGQMDLTFPVPLDPEGRMAERTASTPSRPISSSTAGG